MDLSIVPLHRNLEYLEDCCRLINDEWKRSETARMRSLKNSSDKLPTSLILLHDKRLIGHLKLSPIPMVTDSCFVEAVVIKRQLRGKGFGTTLMMEAEKYCKSLDLKTIYLSTKGQEKFYSKLGYTECQPISIYGNYTPTLSTMNQMRQTENIENKVDVGAPKPPPMPINGATNNHILKTYMKKYL